MVAKIKRKNNGMLSICELNAETEKKNTSFGQHLLNFMDETNDDYVGQLIQM